MSGISIKIPSFAKINLHLQIAGRRSDGFHDLCTIFQTVSLHDTIEFRREGSGTALSSNDPKLPCGESNLIVRAAAALRARFNVSEGISIFLEKRIPHPGGLGGGSSNAAAALMALSKLWNIGAGIDELHEIASGLGSDVPFFLYGGTCLGLGRGTDITQMPEFAEKFILIVTPQIDVPTRIAFAGLATRSLTNDMPNRILQICRLEAESRIFDDRALVNDFEESVFAAFPEIRTVKDTLIELGARRALMSGSGASVFGIFDIEETRQTALKALDERVNWRKFAVAAISRDQFREALAQVY